MISGKWTTIQLQEIDLVTAKPPVSCEPEDLDSSPEDFKALQEHVARRCRKPEAPLTAESGTVIEPPLDTGQHEEASPSTGRPLPTPSYYRIDVRPEKEGTDEDSGNASERGNANSNPPPEDEVSDASPDAVAYAELLTAINRSVVTAAYKEHKKLLENVNIAKDLGFTDTSNVRARYLPLPFFDHGIRLYEVSVPIPGDGDIETRNAGWERRFYYLWGDGSCNEAQGPQFEPVNLNWNGLTLNEFVGKHFSHALLDTCLEQAPETDTAIAHSNASVTLFQFLCFYCAFLAGDEDYPFIVVEDAESFISRYWCDRTDSSLSEQAISFVRNSSIHNSKGDTSIPENTIQVKTNVIYQAGLYRTTLNISRSEPDPTATSAISVTMQDDELFHPKARGEDSPREGMLPLSLENTILRLKKTQGHVYLVGRRDNPANSDTDTQQSRAPAVDWAETHLNDSPHTHRILTNTTILNFHTPFQRFRNPIVIRNCDILGDVDLQSSTVDGSVIFEHCKIRGTQRR